jgi:capsular polysaccharide biosynthesis protein
MFDHREIMAIAGFSRIEADLSDAPIVGVENLTYLDRPTPGALPAAVMSEIRHRILARFDGRGERTRRIYLRPARASHGRIEMERFLLQQSFEPVQLDHMPFRDQVDLFRSAAFVVGSHGAGLSNILFAPPGARVLELMDEARFQPDIWLLASKLGHLHGFLGCHDLDVDTPAFRDLYETLENFRL